MAPTWTRLALGVLFASIVVEGQYSGWIKDQRNTTLCRWLSLRASAIQDTVYLDGGRLAWTPGMSDGSFKIPMTDNNPLALAYKLNFSQPFDTASNFNYTTLLEPMPKAGSGNGGLDVAPNYQDGAMLANDHEFYLYGGTSLNISIYKMQDATDVIGYRLTQYSDSPIPPQFNPAVIFGELTDGVTRYVTYGGGANAPSEHKAWYFGGMRAPSAGPIVTGSSNENVTATEDSQFLITLDMKSQFYEKWYNTTIPSKIAVRANPEVVWVPVGEQGILAVLGGVVYPEYATTSGKSSNEGQSNFDSPKFMEEISIYDVASGEWYKQVTTGDIPGPLAQGCTVLGTAEDASSFNIYWYGGYPAIQANTGFEDAVWVLSLPSFIWTKIADGSGAHARVSHKCVHPYPDQMMVIGGIAQSAGNTVRCLEGAVQVFNMTSAEWMKSYDPTVYMDKYAIPTQVVKAIGGTPAGGATQTKPKGDWDEAGLGSVFAKPYDRSKIATYFPYASAETDQPGRTDLVNQGGGNLPSWVAPVLGVVLGLVFLSALVVGILLFRRRKLLKRNGGTTTVTTADDNGGRILSWIRGQHASEKAPTVMSDETTLHLNDLDSKIAPVVKSHPTGPSTVATYEAPNNTFYEMPDSSRPLELGDTGLSPVEIINKHTHFGQRPPHTRHQSGSWQSGAVSREQARSVSPNYASGSERPDSPPLGNPISSPSSGSLAIAGAGGVHSSATSMTAPAASGLPPNMGNNHQGYDQQQQQSPHQELEAQVPAPQQQQERTTSPPRDAAISGVSLLSEQDRINLRHLSGSSISSTTATLPNSAGLANGFQQHQDHDYQYQHHQHQHYPSTSTTAAEVYGEYPPPVSPGTLDTRNMEIGNVLLSPGPPISPPTAEERDGMDYLTAQPLRQQSPPQQQHTEHRRSVFHENTEDLDQPPQHGHQSR